MVDKLGLELCDGLVDVGSVMCKIVFYT